jgi:predicted DNA-binding protein (MmcQ/YjbR family)
VDAVAELEAFALGLPGAWSDTPWGDDRVTKVAAKIFVFWGAAGGPGLTVKLPESEAHALSLPGAAPCGYGLGRHGWVTIPVTATTDVEVLLDFVEESYRAVAPKRLVRDLDALIAATEDPCAG